MVGEVSGGALSWPPMMPKGASFRSTGARIYSQNSLLLAAWRKNFFCWNGQQMLGKDRRVNTTLLARPGRNFCHRLYEGETPLTIMGPQLSIFGFLDMFKIKM